MGTLTLAALPKWAYAIIIPPNTLRAVYRQRERALIWINPGQKIIKVPYNAYLSQELHLRLMNIHGFDWASLHEAGLIDKDDVINQAQVRRLALYTPSGGINIVAEGLRKMSRAMRP